MNEKNQHGVSMIQNQEKNNDPKPKISVIIPIYNVAPYLPRCLDSCKAQTMRNVQFVLVDDGSTDGGGEIADRYAREDSCFQVFHTENRGLSAALNYGLDKAEADWIMTIDSDDWVAPEFCEAPFAAAKEYNAELVAFNYCYVSDKNRIIKRNLISTRGVVDVVAAVEKGDVYNWNKLYHRRLFENFRFPEGKNHADQLATAQMVYKARRIACIPDHLYYYKRRRGSISWTETVDNCRTGFLSAMGRYNFLMKNGFPKEKLEPYYFYSAMSYLAHVHPSENDEQYKEAVSILDQIQSAPAAFGWKGRIKLAAWKISPSLFHLMYFLAGKKYKS